MSDTILILKVRKSRSERELLNLGEFFNPSIILVGGFCGNYWIYKRSYCRMNIFDFLKSEKKSDKIEEFKSKNNRYKGGN